MRSCLNLEHQVVRALGRTKSPERWLLAVSGGVDSMVMAEVLWRWRRYLGVELTVAHVHHGGAGRGVQGRYRAKAQRLVRGWAIRHGLTFKTNVPDGDLHLRSEAELRAYRVQHLKRWLRDGRFDRVVLAHHLDDLLETRLLRLLRGVGPQGLKAMAARRGRALRPLIEISRGEILAYAEARGLSWVEDPSNRKTDSLRNWLRREWLPNLERRAPGSRRSLARSLATMTTGEFTETVGSSLGLRRAALEELAPEARAAVVARYLRSIGVKGYARTHVNEILKRLGTRQKAVAFEMLGRAFHATPDFLWASRV